MLLLLCPLAGAQVYVNLTAQQVRIDSLLPVFSWQKSLGVIYADSIYDVCIDYPEFIDMSAEDIRRYHAITSEPLSTHHLSLIPHLNPQSFWCEKCGMFLAYNN